MANSAARQPRLATACNWCRSHKLKCDAEQPSCRNCHSRGLECVTTNLRRPDQIGRRQKPLGRRGKGIRQQVSPSNHQRDLANSDSPSTSPPPSPSGNLLAPLIGHDVSLPSIFTAPFSNHEESAEHDPKARGRAKGRLTSESSPNTGLDVSSTPTVNSGRSANLTVITDNTRSRSQFIGNGSSMYVLVQWLDLFFARWDFWKPILPHFQQGMAYSTEVPLSFLTTLPPLPPPPIVDQYLSIFFSKIHPIFPVVDHGMVLELVSVLRPKLERQPASLGSTDYPQLAILYALFSSSADELAGELTDVGTSYLEGAYFLYAHLVAMPYTASVQALLLLAVVLKNRNKDGASWEILGQAIRIAQAVGLHRQSFHAKECPSPVDGTLAADLNSRIWWTAYILERAMEMETGRPSAIRDGECDQSLPQPILTLLPSGSSHNYFGALIRLSRIQTQIAELYHYTKQGRKTKEILHEMGRLDRALLDFAATFPEEVSFIALHRPALMSATAWLRKSVNRLCAGTPWRTRLRYGLCLSAASARSILKALSDMRLYSTPSRLITLSQMTLAILVLSIYVTRLPSSLMNSSDLSLATSFSEVAEQEYLKIGQDTDFAEGLSILRNQLSQHVNCTKPQHRPEDSGQHPPASTSAKHVTDQPFSHVDTDFDFGQLDDAWPSLWSDDLGNFSWDDTNQEMMNAYLLGLP
ncbi:hypothetical protein PV08_11708 [Exophiala spinifera]|uniref:Zn(2)-C6 fungal-type domain-containing protein n=1 Tax=Exophiala spinifera TaxID=91928 RepID=A0A0D1ZA90_9EURO|nr:uncharacterized protein PV08_11708 [Exophiala spinifera]KIW09932.1 hypothetical protein PV08_11708 [Exophiala spinifera]